VNVTRTAGVAGTFTASFTQAPVGTPTVTIYSDPARTLVAVATAPMVATANATAWTASYPATLSAGTFYLVFSAVYTLGQPAVLDQDDTLVLTAPGVGLTASLVTLAEAKTYMGVTSAAHDVEITRYCGQALGVVENMAGPALVRRSFTERYDGGRSLLLHRYPVVSVQSGGSVVNGAVTLATGLTSYAVIDGTIGRVGSPFGYGTVEVTYTAGLEVVPDEAVDAALVFVSYKYRRNHGGSESYMPAGVDGGIAPPMGTKALRDQIRLALGPYARGVTVA
jgi:hypothetical protein